MAAAASRKWADGPAGAFLVASITAAAVTAVVIVVMAISMNVESMMNGRYALDGHRSAHRFWFPNVPVAAAMLLPLLRGCTWLARRFVGSLGGAIAFLGAAATTPVFGYHLHRGLGYALNHYSTFGVDYLEIEVVAPWAAFLAAIGCAIAWGIMRLSASRSDLRARGLRIIAGVTLAIGAMAVVFGAARSKRPEAEHYVASLPVVMTLPSIVDELGPGQTETQSFNEPDTMIEADSPDVGPLFIRRSWAPLDHCRFHIHASLVRKPETDHGWSVLGLERGGTIRRDAKHGLLVLDSVTGDRMWFDATTGAYAYPTIDRSTIGPPSRWVLGGLFGVLAAVIAMAWRPAVARRATRLAHARPGHYDGERVTFDDGTPPFEAKEALRDVPQGPVLVLPLAKLSQPSFREQGAIHDAEVASGTLAEIRALADDAWSTRASFAIASVAITCCPLLLG